MMEESFNQIEAEVGVTASEENEICESIAECDETAVDTRDSDIPSDEELSDDGDGDDGKYYEKLIESDLAELRRTFSELRTIEDITELENPVRYAALRDLGLTPEEAYRASTTHLSRKADNRAHLSPTVKKRAMSAGDIPFRDMQIAKSLFSDLSDSEIRKLYRKVTK